VAASLLGRLCLFCLESLQVFLFATDHPSSVSTFVTMILGVLDPFQGA
jgi:hypothetical protein